MMKIGVLVFVVAAMVSVNAATDSPGPGRGHTPPTKDNAICYKQCPEGQWCARGTTLCRPPMANTTECFNYATARWIPKCDPGFECKKGKCDYKTNSKSNTENRAGVPGGAICYKRCPRGQWCARGTNTCLSPSGDADCFDLSQGLWIPTCTAGFTCKDGKCT